MTIAEMAKVVREYFAALTAEGFTAAEAMQITLSYQQTLLQNDLIERMQTRDGKPWER